MMFPTAVKGHIPFAPTYGERIEKHQKIERRRRAVSSASSDEYVAKRKATSVAAKPSKMSLPSQYSPKRPAYSVAKKSTRNAIIFGELERRMSDHCVELSITNDSEIAVSVSVFGKTNDLSRVVSPTDHNRKRAPFFKSLINLFRRRTRLSIDVHADGDGMEQSTVATALDGLRLSDRVLCECACDCTYSETPQLVTSSAKGQSSARQRRSVTLRLASILEEDDELEEEENEDFTESDSAIDVREIDVPSVGEHFRCS